MLLQSHKVKPIQDGNGKGRNWYTDIISLFLFKVSKQKHLWLTVSSIHKILLHNEVVCLDLHEFCAILKKGQHGEWKGGKKMEGARKTRNIYCHVVITDDLTACREIPFGNKHKPHLLLHQLFQCLLLGTLLSRGVTTQSSYFSTR